MKKFYAFLNFIIIVLLIAWNYIANSIGINDNTVGSLSDEYYNLFTPAGYAFSIWGIIYLGLLAHTIYQINCIFTNKPDDFILHIGKWLALANIANGIWLWFWLNEMTLLSVATMLVLLISLIVIIVKLNMEKWDAPLHILAFIWWPFCLYSGWIAVATIANISAYLAKIGWSAFFSEEVWTVIMLVVATFINALLVFTRNMREFAAVGIWALVAIAVRHWTTIPILQWTAVVCAGILFVITSIHGYRNRKQNPMYRMMNKD